MPSESTQYLYRAIYYKLKGTTPDLGATKSNEYWLGLIYDALYGTNYSPRGGLKSEYYWLKLMRAKVLTDYGIDLLGNKSLEDTLNQWLLVAGTTTTVTPLGLDFSYADNSGLFMVIMH
jgi:hypothetical protein